MSVAKLRLVVEAPAPARRAGRGAHAAPRLTQVQETWLKRGLDQPGGKLPLFDKFGKRIHPRTIQHCVAVGWAEPWFANPAKPDWQVCKITDAGRERVAESGGGPRAVG
jgi:hypothetical protein